VDTWLLLRDVESGGERNRGLNVLKSRGMAHSNQIREFLIRDDGLELIDVYRGPAGPLTGTMRVAQEARERAEELARQQGREARARERQLARESLEARIAALRHEFDAAEVEAGVLDRQDAAREATISAQREALALRRGGAGRLRGKADGKKGQS
jgi:circadian clock protein KaiC